MTTVAALVATVLLGLLAVFQLALVLGAPIGRFAWGGAHDVLPRRLRVGSAVSIVLYAAFAVVALDRAGLVDLLPDGVSTVGAWVLAAYFLVGIVMNGISRSLPERFTMTPVCLVLCAAYLVLAWAA
ncbi:hypothetical protein [Actinotalea sp. K2]|uniref:hypothetical protein n=1 Tax=Actinotalea sp. K2 TaxID=2939438 RepID=UPI0020179F17|nr:hypothetical protein [Actinotalea sp. K2]MCL3859669.1 hypothetical protein [Actinotalea sp. K2]